MVTCVCTYGMQVGAHEHMTIVCQHQLRQQANISRLTSCIMVTPAAAPNVTGTYVLPVWHGLQALQQQGHARLKLGHDAVPKVEAVLHAWCMLWCMLWC